jgi:hypothetical protein
MAKILERKFDSGIEHYTLFDLVDFLDDRTGNLGVETNAKSISLDHSRRLLMPKYGTERASRDHISYSRLLSSIYANRRLLRR